jgi:hypothetical protein
MKANILIIYEGNNRRALDKTIQSLKLNDMNVIELCADGWQ